MKEIKYYTAHFKRIQVGMTSNPYQFAQGFAAGMDLKKGKCKKMEKPQDAASPNILFTIFPSRTLLTFKPWNSGGRK